MWLVLGSMRRPVAVAVAVLAIALFVIGLALLGDGLQQVWSVSEEGREEPQPSLSFREPEVAV